MSKTNFSAEEIASWPEGTKKCWGCKRLLPLSAFHVMKQGLFGVNTYCKECRKPMAKTYYSTISDEKLLWQRAKARAAKSGREFAIAVEDIVIPERCPVLDIPLYKIGPKETDNSPSLDRIDSSRGYTPDNIVVMSNKANMWKNSMTPHDIVMLYRYMCGITGVIAIRTFHETWCKDDPYGRMHSECELPNEH